MRKDLEKKVVDAIFYGNNGDPVKDFIDQGEMLEALTCLFVELYGKHYLQTALDDGEWDRISSRKLEERIMRAGE